VKASLSRHGFCPVERKGTLSKRSNSQTMDDSGERIISTELVVDASLAQSLQDVDQELDDCVRTIQENGFERVALQIPDEMLSLTWSLVQKLKEKLAKSECDGVELFVLGDTSYGSCCVDEVAAEHHRADFIVHFGQACLSRTARLPVHYVFGKCRLDVAEAAKIISQSVDNKGGKLTMIRDVRFEHCIEFLRDKLLERQTFSEADVPSLVRKGFVSGKNEAEEPEKEVVLGHSLENGRDFGTVLYVGNNEKQIAVLFLQLSAREIVCFDPVTMKCIKPDRAAKTTLARRFRKVQQARDAQIFGILVGTMGIHGYSKALQRIQDMIRAAGKKSYTFLMGKINPQKLANFPHIDVFVLVACPQNSLLDSKEFFKPIVTPHELEISLDRKQWSTEYILSFSELAAQVINENISNGSDEPHFSLVTGGLISNSVASSQAPSASKDAIVSKAENRHITIRYSSPAGDKLMDQSFRGLEPSKGDRVPEKSRKGQVGIASALYSMEDGGKEAPK